ENRVAAHAVLDRLELKKRPERDLDREIVVARSQGVEGAFRLEGGRVLRAQLLLREGERLRERGFGRSALPLAAVEGRQLIQAGDEARFVSFNGRDRRDRGQNFPFGVRGAPI